ncbi:MAG TPA: hypothetical protein VIC06_00905 [Solirubrobacteraceae bacterium]
MLRLRGVVLAGLVVVSLGLMCGSASAAFKYSFTGALEAATGFGGLEASSVAVDDGDGRTYIADSGSGTVDVFETSSRAQLGSWDGSAVTNPPGTPAGSFGGGHVAVAANNATGDVYVLDSTNNVVDVFDSAGGYVCQITGKATPSASECNGAAGSDTPAHGFNAPHGIAVDQATGEVFVVDAFNEVVDVFSVDGAYLRQISLTSVPIGENSLYMNDIAVDDFNGRVYLGNNVTRGVYALDALSGTYVASWNGNNTPPGSFGHKNISVAAHNASGDVYVTDSEDEVTDVFAPGGEYLTQITESATGEFGGRGTAVDQANADVYISDNEVGKVYLFSALFVPDVSTGVASNVRPTSVTLNGAVNPDGVPVTACFFEYGTEGSYGQSAPCAQSPGSGASPVAVSADLSGLQEGVTYNYRLVAENANGANQSASAEITMPSPPSIDSAAAENIVSGSADLHVAINPHAAQTSYRFEYGASAEYGTSAPVPDGSIAEGLSDRTITQHVSGLQANTTYHWRVVARNIAGTTTGVDHTFIYDTGGEGLPDNRAYEMVTPPQKNGALIGHLLGLNSAPDITEDGTRVIAKSIQCFGGVGACNANREGYEGDPIELLRSTGGWVAESLVPPATQFGDNSPLLESATAGTALFLVPTRPVGEDDLVAHLPDGSFGDIGPVTAPSENVTGEPIFSSVATADLSHVVYVLAGSKWPFDATNETGNQKTFTTVYEYVGVGGAAPALVGVSGGAGSTDLISACNTSLPNGPGSSFHYNSMSANGGTVFFTAEPCASGSGANAGVPVPAATLYARIDESRTVLISGRSSSGCRSAACLGSAASKAEFQGASTDGRRVFFTSTQQLTDDATEGDENLYEYDFSRPAGENLTAVSVGDTSGGGPGVTGVEAISSDGTHVYFAATGVLTGVANSRGQVARAGAENLYVFERDASYPQGRVAFVAVLPPSDEEFGRDTTHEGPGYVGGVGTANVTPDGRFLVFLSHGRLTPDDTSTTGAVQVFRYDAQTGELVRISTGEGGFNDNGNAGVGDAGIVPSLDTFYRAGSPRPDPTMSHDGSFVFFESPVALTPRALNNVQVGTDSGQPEYAMNVYEWHEGHVYLISDGKDTSAIALGGGSARPTDGFSAVELLGSDASGANVFFATSDRLVPQDTDTQRDYYDARVCTTGDPCVAAPATPVLPCVGEGCRGAPGGPPSLASPVSASFVGAGNLAAEAKPVVKAKKTKPTRRAHGKKKGKAKKRSKGRRRVAGGRGKAVGSSRSTRRGR